MNVCPPEIFTTIEINSEANPVEVMQPATSPAIAQATATVITPLPPASRASRIFFKFILSSELNNPTIMLIPIATVAENCIVYIFVETKITRIINGNNKYIFGNKFFNFGNSSFGIPFKPNFLASRWTAIYIPTKYNTAGKIAFNATSEYGIPIYSAIKNAAAPIIGGMICPPVDAAASTAPANSDLYPVRFIIGIVTEPVVTVLPTEDPETIPHKAEEITATFAGPPALAPATALAKSIKNFEIPVRSRNAPKIINTTIYFAHTSIGTLLKPSPVE